MNAPGPHRRPLLVTGSHRSGTTWVGQMLSLSKQVGVLHEPFNPDNHRSWLAVDDLPWFAYVDDHNDAIYREPFEQVLALRPPLARLMRQTHGRRDVGAVGRELGRAIAWRTRRQRLLIKDPIAFFAAPWIARSFDADVLVLVRHPAAFASSLVRLEWAFDFTSWSEQPELMDGPLHAHRDEILAAAKRPPALLDQAILLWRSINQVALDYRTQHPAWKVVRYEDLAGAPLEQFPSLYAAFGLRWDEETARAALPFTSSEGGGETAVTDPMNVRRDSASSRFTWLQRLDPCQIATIRRGTADVAEAFYGSEDWG